MSRIRHGDKLRSGYRPGVGRAVFGAGNAILFAPDNECRDIHPSKPVFETGVVHVGLPAEMRDGFTGLRQRPHLPLVR